MVETEAGPERVVATFRLPDVHGASSANVVGEFNDWSETAHPMVRTGDGFQAQIALDPGRAYRFRYLLDGERWENDWSADAYVPNEFGGDDSVIDLTDVKVAGAPKRASRGKSGTKAAAKEAGNGAKASDGASDGDGTDGKAAAPGRTSAKKSTAKKST